MTTHGWNFGVSDILNLPSSQGTGYVLAPDGAGGLTWIATSTIGVTDHGGLTGLADDDHTQYHTDGRALTWHGAFASTHVTGGDLHDHSGGDGAQIDHGGLAGLSDDDHTGYLLATGARTGASSSIQPFTNGVQLPIVRATSSSIIFKDSTGATSWLTTTGSEITLHPSDYIVQTSARTNIKTYSDVFHEGIYINNASGQSIAYFSPAQRTAAFGAASLSGYVYTLSTWAASNMVALNVLAHASQTTDVVQFGDKNGAWSYQLTYDNKHNYLGNLYVAGRVNSAPAFDRLQGAAQRYTLTFANHTYVDANELFAGGHNGAWFRCNATVEGSVEIDFNPAVGWTANTNTGYTYISGYLMVSFWPGFYAKDTKVDIYLYGGGGAGVDGWITDAASVQNNISDTIGFRLNAGVYGKKIKLRFSDPSHAVWVAGISYFPDIPENTSEMTGLPRFASERVKAANKGIDYYDTAWTVRHSMDYQVTDGATAVAYMHDTTNALSTSGAKLALWKNNGTLKMSIDKDGQLVPVGGILLSATNLVTDTTTGTMLATGSTQKLGAWGATPVARQSAFTQTYSTADKTLSAYTSDAEGSAYTGIDNLQVGTVYAQLTDLNALRTAYENLRTFTEDTAQMLNSVVDDLQTIGWLA